MYTKRRSNPWAWCAVLALGVGLSAGAARADDDPPDRVARVSFLSGSVSFQPAGDDQWAEAALNRPLGTGDKVYTDKDSRVELEIGAADIRLDQSSTFNLLNLDDNTAQIELTEGTVNLHVRRVDSGQSYEVDTPTLAFVVNQPGNYRIDIAPQGDSTMVTVFDGNGDVYGENNASYSVRAGNTYRFNDSALHDYEVLDLPRGDDFDQWCSTRNTRYERSPSRQYVSEDMIGYADLDEAGSWSTAPEYGNVWYPNTVEADWAPYRSGHWSWIDPWGWSWVDSAPWGFAPFHYGRWAYVGNRWGWCPGAYRGRSIYAPALVAFVGGVGISVGGGGPVGWFPLGPREAYVPWYRSSRNYFTNVNVRNTTFVNNTYITNVYNNYSRGRPITGVNYAYRNNMTAVPRDAFVGARPVNAARVQINDRELRNAQVVSRVGIAPTQASFAGNAVRGGRAMPTAAVMDRRVIARTAPPARSAPIASRIQAIERNGAQPLPASQARAIVARPGTNAAQNRAVNSRVQLVGQNNAAKPQPLPARGAAPVNAQRPNVANDRAALPGARGPQTPTNPASVNRAPVTAPANPGANTVQRGQSNAPDRSSLPSSRFAPHAGMPANGNAATNPAATRNAQPGANATNRSVPNSVQRGSNPATVDRSNAQMPVQRTAPQRTSPSIDRGNATAPQGQIRPAPQLREIQRNTSPAQNPTRSVQQPQVQPRNAQQPAVQRSAPAQPQYQQQRVEQPQRSVQQPQGQQPRNVQPVQPRNVPQPQVQRNPSPPPQQQREQRGERGKDKDKDGH